MYRHSYVSGVSRPKHPEARPVLTHSYTHNAYMLICVGVDIIALYIFVCRHTVISVFITFELCQRFISQEIFCLSETCLVTLVFQEPCKDQPHLRRHDLLLRLRLELTTSRHNRIVVRQMETI